MELERYFVRNEDNGLIEIWLMPLSFGDGHYTKSIEAVVNEGFSSQGYLKKEEAEKFKAEVQNHYLRKHDKIPNLSVVKVKINLEIIPEKV